MLNNEQNNNNNENKQYSVKAYIKNKFEQKVYLLFLTFNLIFKKKI